jgi:transcription elongation factor/antiterminator RfaH
MGRWYLLQTLPRRELTAVAHLIRQGFTTFLPQFWKTTRHARTLRTIKAPLFPGYLFVWLDLSRDRWLCVRSTLGVSRLLSTRDGSPFPVPSGIVETLIQSSGGDVTRLDAGLVQGQTVRILSGPFADLIGTLKRLDDAGRVQVLLRMMGAAVAVSVHRSVLSPAA